MCLQSEFLNCTLPCIKKGVELPGLPGGSYIIHACTEHPDDSKAMEIILEKKDAETSTDPFVGY